MRWRDEVIRVAFEEIGTTELPPGSNKVKYNTWYYGREVSGAAYPWCMAFVQWVFASAGQALPFKTASCSALLDWYGKYRPESVVTDPERGSIPIYTFGHTGIVDAVDPDGTFYAVEGNTSASEKGSQSNGGGVFRKQRSVSQVKKFIVPYGEDEDMLDGKEILDRVQKYLNTQKVPDWAGAELEEARKLGITDGTYPMQMIPRYQAAIMAKRAVDAAVERI